ncbi:MAG: hypothetical protein M3541_06775 [Acidobacteriota bacterium]|nr:hypothetical protein [Acidobacteriota bacterium]MDQ3418474.1 hypothetical protein [Acidobacteriota bacterium]
MIRMSLLSIAFTALAVLPPSLRPETVVKVNGWFSDKDCAAAKVKGEEVTPNGTACVKKCLDDGAAAVFVDPKARELYEVRDHVTVKDDVGYYLELTGVVDEKAKTISVRSVKRLGDVVQMCARPAKK